MKRKSVAQCGFYVCMAVSLAVSCRPADVADVGRGPVPAAADSLLARPLAAGPEKAAARAVRTDKFVNFVPDKKNVYP